ncbi:LysM peptidoglycan-binding domain-containing protein [Cytobacillus firmus]|uniref:C40 family peptidase n=1 Tax=Cytobacillus firmus TaxID=1399 RepID=UPI0021847414|nr:LysM peptidoglycan-binding domain-containing protein [Cytobacillus firmus]URM33391.1 LysM peptidoglycan-binding domain-containing protein [Cytobacillus firmus]
MKKQMASIAAAAILSSGFAAQASAEAYVVKKGDTLYQLSLKYSTSVPEIKKLNGLKSDNIFINQKLQLPGKVVKSESSTPAAPAKETVNTYTVQSGDTLSKIAAQHNISLNDLMKLNNLTNHLIYPGQVFKLTSNAVSSPADQKDTASSNPTPAQTAESLYAVTKGDTLSGIASRNKVTVQQIKTWNNLNSDLIFIGQKLRLGANTNGSQTGEVKESQSAASSLLAEAKKHIGVPYKWGGSTPEGFDCSGFIYYVLNKSGSKLGRYSAEGYYSRSFYIDKPQPGDLVFFENTYKQGISHMGFYLGDNQFIHASSNGIEITNLNNSYYKKHFDGFKRFY